jgi:predicted glycogen debranching enzyme
MPPQFSREWLETNGIGGFASGTIAGAVSRRYHAFLCAATRAPQERAILVSKIEESVIVNDETFELSANIWRGAVSPRGDQFLTEFALDPLPRWVYELPLARGTLRLEKTVWMPRESNTSIASHRILSGPACRISLRPFVTGRDYHSTHRANLDFNTETRISTGQVTMQPYPHLPAFHFFTRRICAPGRLVLLFRVAH